MELRSRAPLRVSFAGGGTDVSPFPEQEGGAVLSATIDRYAHVGLRSRTDQHITIHSADFATTVHIPADSPLEAAEGLDLVRAAISRGCSRSTGFDLWLESGAPPGSGLGSSSTVMVALIHVLKLLEGRGAKPYELARTAWEVERHELGIVGGKQDHYAAAFGGFNFIEFDGDEVLVNPLRVPAETVNELEHNILLAYTGITRESGAIIEDQSGRVSCGQLSVLDALREQKALAAEMKRMLLTNRLDDFGELLEVAWAAKKRMSPKITNSAIDEAHDIALKNGALGGKVTGAGGGGYLMVYSPFQCTHNVAMALEAAQLTVQKIAFTPKGSESWERS